MEGLINDEQQKGIIPRVINGLFEAVTAKSKNASDPKTNKKSQEFLIRVSFVEIYMERIRDLLVSTKNGKFVEKSYIDPLNLQIHENKVKGIYIEGVIEKTVSTVQELLQIMSFGKHYKTFIALKFFNEWL
jgi:kinesin family protein 5